MFKTLIAVMAQAALCAAVSINEDRQAIIETAPAVSVDIQMFRTEGCGGNDVHLTALTVDETTHIWTRRGGCVGGSRVQPFDAGQQVSPV